jgi:predicted MPP superfamily phosphohydrolase
MPWAIRTLLTISAVALPLYIYVLLRTAASIGSLYPGRKRNARWIALLVLAWLYAIPLIFLILTLAGSRMMVLDLEGPRGISDYLFLYPQWISLVIVLELLAPFIVLDIAGLVSRLFPARREWWRMFLARMRLALAGLVLLYVPVRIAVDTTHVHDEVVEARINGLPAGLQGLRLTLLGDIQVDRYTGRSTIDAVHEIVHARQPELLFSSGDVVTSGTAYLGQAAEALGGIRGSLATIGVMGDHDQWSAPDAIRSIHRKCGWTFLENEHRVISWRGKRILVTGLTHIYSQKLNPERLDRILDRAPEADISIILVHQPAEWLIHRAASRGYSLVLAGHTHGGQIVLHPLGIPLTPSMRETRYYSGAYRVGQTSVVVTDGVGLTLAPIRYHASSEVTTIVLQPDDPE